MSFKFSITLSSFKDLEPLNDTLKNLKKCQLGALEMYGEPRLVDVRQTLDLCQSYGLRICGITGMWGASGYESNRILLTSDKSTFDKTMEYIKSCIQMCNVLGGSVFNICIFNDYSYPEIDPNHRVYRGSVKKHFLSKIVEKLRELSRFAGDYGVDLLIEPLNRYSTPFCSTATDALFLANTVQEDNLGILLDTFHMNIEESSMRQTIEESRYLLKHMHISDNNRKMPGLGHINFGEIINSLKRINFGGFLSFEPYISSKDYQKDILYGIDTLTKVR